MSEEYDLWLYGLKTQPKYCVQCKRSLKLKEHTWFNPLTGEKEITERYLECSIRFGSIFEHPKYRYQSHKDEWHLFD